MPQGHQIRHSELAHQPHQRQKRMRRCCAFTYCFRYVHGLLLFESMRNSSSVNFSSEPFFLLVLFVCFVPTWRPYELTARRQHLLNVPSSA